ncbi:MAG: bifunctional demethylmenaquinone methyltransferase/2-methoxy-6-polyprenyl-1,4-benzoquinol methylase UbiE [Nitrospirae bacterium]|nr:MAG: bifunctional demethylmenaquinone methyltransferase/2-methoxy-6-polyprenyl-1,4-benzoquinol methylase UbiE [Nitrospirota bacterium]
MLTLEEQRETAPPSGTGPQKEQAVQRMFSSIARYYDLNNTLLSLGLHHSWKRKAVELMARESVKLVLDAGAGTADLALLAARHLGAKARIVAADLNRPMLAIGVEKVRKATLQRQIVCVQANAEHLSAPNATFDAVTTGFCMRNVADLPRALQEIRRVLKPGGRLICLEFSRPVAGWLRRLYDWYSFTLLPWIGTRVSGDTTGVYRYLPASIRSFPDQDGLARLLREIGFEKVKYHNLSGGIVAIHVAVK